MGTENKKNYLGAFKVLDDIPDRPKQKPGPKPKETTGAKTKESA
jgi:hypothetical protein